MYLEEDSSAVRRWKKQAGKTNKRQMRNSSFNDNDFSQKNSNSFNNIIDYI